MYSMLAIFITVAHLLIWFVTGELFWFHDIHTRLGYLVFNWMFPITTWFIYLLMKGKFDKYM